MKNVVAKMKKIHWMRLTTGKIMQQARLVNLKTQQEKLSKMKHKVKKKLKKIEQSTVNNGIFSSSLTSMELELHKRKEGNRKIFKEIMA